MSDQVMEIQTQGEKITIGMSRHYKYFLGIISIFMEQKCHPGARGNQNNISKRQTHLRIFRHYLYGEQSKSN